VNPFVAARWQKTESQINGAAATDMAATNTHAAIARMLDGGGFSKPGPLMAPARSPEVDELSGYRPGQAVIGQARPAPYCVAAFQAPNSWPANA
jgi:hypothetical protein